MKKLEEKENTLFLDFYAGKHGTPIARTSEGKTCLLNIENCKKKKVYVHVGEQWKCQVDEEKENKVIVTPINMTLDAKENEYFFREKAKILGTKFDKVTIK